MPLTKTEIFYFGLGISIGAVTGAHWQKIRPLLEPLLGSMSGGCRDAYGDLSSLLAERFGEQISTESAAQTRSGVTLNGDGGASVPSSNVCDTHGSNSESKSRSRKRSTDLSRTNVTRPRKMTSQCAGRIRPVYRKSRVSSIGTGMFLPRVDALTTNDEGSEKMMTRYGNIE